SRSDHGRDQDRQRHDPASRAGAGPVGDKAVLGQALAGARIEQAGMARLKENSIRRAVREGRAALGTGLKEFASRGVPRIIESSGFDYCMIDMDHGAFDMKEIADLAAWFAATEISPIVRLHKSFMHLIPGILDQGIMGIQISEVDNADEARAIVELAKYPPV